jgi:hypothetical protein
MLLWQQKWSLAMATNNSSKDRLLAGLSKVPAQPPIKKAPTTYPLSTQAPQAPIESETQEREVAPTQEREAAPTQEREVAPTQERSNATMRNSENAPAPAPAPAPAKEPERVSRGYKLREDYIKRLKFIALQQDRHLYEVMEDAMEQYIERNEVEN